MNEGKLWAYASLAEVVSAPALIASLLNAGYEFRRSDPETLVEARTAGAASPTN